MLRWTGFVSITEVFSGSAHPDYNTLPFSATVGFLCPDLVITIFEIFAATTKTMWMNGIPVMVLTVFFHCLSSFPWNHSLPKKLFTVIETLSLGGDVDFV